MTGIVPDINLTEKEALLMMIWFASDNRAHKGMTLVSIGRVSDI